MSSLPHPPMPSGLPKSLADLRKSISVWFLITFPTLDHLYRQQVLDGDAIILHLAERELYHKAEGDWRRNYFMPAPADAQVSTFRRWFDAFGAAAPTCSPAEIDAMGPPLPKEQVLDRWSQHTHSCSHCLGALRILDAAIPACAVLGCIAAIAAVAVLVLMTTSSSMLHSLFSVPAGAASPNLSATLTGSDAPSLSINAPTASTAAVVAMALRVGMLLPCGLSTAAAATAIAASFATAMLFAVKVLQRWRACYFYLGYDHSSS